MYAWNLFITFLKNGTNSWHLDENLSRKHILIDCANSCIWPTPEKYTFQQKPSFVARTTTTSLMLFWTYYLMVNVPLQKHLDILHVYSNLEGNKSVKQTLNTKLGKVSLHVVTARFSFCWSSTPLPCLPFPSFHWKKIYCSV